jgi:hypothetical protein
MFYSFQVNVNKFWMIYTMIKRVIVNYPWIWRFWATYTLIVDITTTAIIKAFILSFHNIIRFNSGISGISGGMGFCAQSWFWSGDNSFESGDKLSKYGDKACSPEIPDIFFSISYGWWFFRLHPCYSEYNLLRMWQTNMEFILFQQMEAPSVHKTWSMLNPNNSQICYSSL